MQLQEIGCCLAFTALDLEAHVQQLMQAYQTTDLRGMADGCLKMPRNKGI